MVLTTLLLKPAKKGIQLRIIVVVGHTGSLHSWFVAGYYCKLLRLPTPPINPLDTSA